MGNHATHERRPKDGSGSAHVPRLEEVTQTNVDKPRTVILKSQQSEDDHEPAFCPKSPDEKDINDPIRQIPQDNCKYMPNIIRWPGGGTDVYLKADFVPGKKLKMIKSEKDFVALIDLTEGDFEYCFEVDGEIKVNPNDEIASTDDGSEKNVISIKKEDFDELERELLCDPNDVQGVNYGKIGSNLLRQSGDHGDVGYGQQIPEYKPNEKVKDPPVLPPHLLQVILNKDTPVSCEPTLLPEPNHVIVNHMYALSIRDGMMVLSTTHRYKKKSVTTLIYRPI